MITYLEYALTICHNCYRNEPSYNCPTPVLVRIRQITNKPYNFSDLTQQKSIFPYSGRVLQESSAMLDSCSSPISYPVLLHGSVLLKKKCRTPSHFSKALVRNDTITFTNPTSLLWLKHTRLTTYNCKGWMKWRLVLQSPNRKKTCIWVSKNSTVFPSKFFLNINYCHMVKRVERVIL